MDDNAKKHLAIDALPGYVPEIGRAIWALEDTRRRTKEELASLEPAMIDWAPSLSDDSIGTILYHMAAIEADWFYVEVLQSDSFDPEITAHFSVDVRDDQGRLSAVVETTLDGHLNRLNAVRERVLATFQTMTLDDFRRARDLPDYAVTPEWVLHHLMQHEAEHRGQIGTLRALAARAGAAG